MHRRLTVTALLCVLAAGGGCARTLPADPVSAAAFRDLERLVSLSEAAGWKIDRIELEHLLPEALLTVCQLDEARQRGLSLWLEQQIRGHGGDVTRAYEDRGRSLRRVTALLRLTRIRRALEHARASRDDCPFWVHPSETFRGRQISDDRFTFSFGGGGKGIFVHQGERSDINFGGAGRLLLGFNPGSRVGLFTGLELGASASFPKNDTGDRGTLVFGFDLVAPLVYRHYLVNAYWEFEAGYLAHVTEDDPSDIDHGVHLGIAVGGRASRRRLLFPGVVFGVSYERLPPQEGSPAQDAVKLGFRVAFDIDFGQR